MEEREQVPMAAAEAEAEEDMLEKQLVPASYQHLKLSSSEAQAEHLTLVRIVQPLEGEVVETVRREQ